MTEEVQDTSDDWGDDHQSLEAIQTEEALSELYGGDDAESDVDESSYEFATSESEEQDAGAGDDYQAAPEQTVAPEPPSLPSAEAIEDLRLSPTEWARLNQVGQEIQRLRIDERRLANVKANIQRKGGLFKAVDGDREKEVMVRLDIAELEESVRRRQAGEQKLQQHLSDQATQHHVAASQRRLFEQTPDLQDPENRAALAGFLVESGLSVEEVTAISPSQAAAAWNMYRKVEAAGKSVHSATKKNLRIPKVGKAKRGSSNQRAPNAETKSPGTMLVERFYGAVETPTAPRVKSPDFLNAMYGE